MKNSIFGKIALLVLSVALCFAPILDATAIVVSAAESYEDRYVAQVLDTKYETLRHAWTAVANGGTITLLKDCPLDTVLTVNENAAVTVNMNGFMIDRDLKNAKESGEIFLVKTGALLNLRNNGADTAHVGTLKDGRWFYQGEGKGNYVINGSLLTGGYNNNGGGAIHIQSNAEVRMEGVTVAGNVTTDDEIGGAIRLQGEGAVLKMENSTLCYNVSKNGGGAAIRVEGKDSQVTIKNSVITHNTVEVDYGDGGAIQINNGTVTLENSKISYNTAGRRGGGIYISNGNLILDDDTVIAYNTAPKEGGAIYADDGADKVEIRGKLYGNHANEEGGAIYVNSEVNESKGVKIYSAEILGNTAYGNGGAIYVDPDDSISLFGKTTIASNSPNNLYIKNKNNIKENGLEADSRIGLITSWNAKSSDPVKTTNYKYFTSDKQGYQIAGNETSLYFKKVDTSNPSSYEIGGTTYPVSKHTFSYPSSTGGIISPTFFYSDGFFHDAPKYYNEHLATLSVSMALAAMQNKFEGDYTEDKAAKNIIDMLVTMGFGDVFVHFPSPEYFGPDAENLSTIGYVIAKKTITVGGAQKTIIATAVRGGGYGAEWASNVTLGSGLGEAQGFGDAARQVKAGIDAYIAAHSLEGDSTSFFITGYSRAAATSNLVAKRLTDTYGEDRVYAYCFETPMGGVESELKDGHDYLNIHNVVNGADVVTTVGTEQMGFIRYGVDHIIPSAKVGTSRYEDQKELMLAQLQAINKSLEFEDRFKEATIKYIREGIDFFDLFDMISENTFTDFDKAEDWVPYFIEKLQEFSLTDLLDKAGISENDKLTNDSYKDYDANNVFNKKYEGWYGYRNFWADYEWYLYTDVNDGNKVKIKTYANQPADFATANYTVLSIEDAMANLMDFYFGASGEKKSAIADVLDLGSMMSKINKNSIYFDIIGEWNAFDIETKNKEFNKLWNQLGIAESLKGVIPADEITDLTYSIFVVADFLLDFVSDDYDKEDQDILGTLINNIGNILQTHYQDVTYSWVRSYDSFYSDLAYVCPHEFGENIIVTEPTNSDYGVSKRVCAKCGAETFEAIPAVAAHTASLFGEGSLVTILTMAGILVCASVVVIIVLRKNRSASKVAADTDGADTDGESEK